MTILMLFTGSYPYPVAAEDTFLPQELSVLSRHFAEIMVVPMSTEGGRNPIDLPNVNVDTTFASNAQSRTGKLWSLIRAVVDPEFVAECIANLSVITSHPAALRRAVSYYVRSRMAERWAREHLPRRASRDDVILYTWWFDAPTLGLARWGKRNGVHVITRAHGYDLYESRHTPPYIPFRRLALELLDRVYPDSDAGARHLAKTYPMVASKIEVGRLGISDPGFVNQASSDGVLRIVSCSILSPVKRIDLLIRALAQLGADCTGLRVSWVHIGDGPDKTKLERVARDTLPPNVQWSLPGYPGRKGLDEFYRHEPLDLFVNVSPSEGTPVSIMEALSVGLPVLCTAVGGNIETVANGNGVLVSSNPSPSEISEGIQALIQNRERMIEMRAASREHWQSRYNAERNYLAFAESISRRNATSPSRSERNGQ